MLSRRRATVEVWKEFPRVAWRSSSARPGSVFLYNFLSNFFEAIDVFGAPPVKGPALLSYPLCWVYEGFGKSFCLENSWWVKSNIRPSHLHLPQEQVGEATHQLLLIQITLGEGFQTSRFCKSDKVLCPEATSSSETGPLEMVWAAAAKAHQDFGNAVENSRLCLCLHTSGPSPLLRSEVPKKLEPRTVGS